MYQKIKFMLSLILFMIGTVLLNAQTDTIVSNVSNARQGEIVMSKSELLSFLEKIALDRKEILQQDLDNSVLPYNNYNVNTVRGYAPASASMPISSNIPVQSMSRDDLIREIDALHSRLNYMYGYGGAGGGTGNSTTFLTTPGNVQGGGYYPYPYQTQSPVASGGGLPLAVPISSNGDLRWKIDSLQRQINSLTVADTFTPIEKKDEILKLNQEIEQAQDSLIASSTLTPEAKEIVKHYGTSEMKVLFDNDASEVSSQYHDEVERAAIVLRKNPQLGVVLKGFASPVGNKKYNYDLSMRRNEAVKRMMIDYGVFPDQISSVFYGEDKTSTESNARRVEIKFIIK